MEKLTRVLSSFTSKPYRSGDVESSMGSPPYLNPDGYVDFAPGDVANPRNWSVSRRWRVTLVVTPLVFNATLASSIPEGCISGIAAEFGVSTEAARLTVTLFLLGYVAGPLLFAPLSEFFGRRKVFLATFSSYIVFNFLCAFAPNFGSLLVGRFLTGTFVSAPLSNAPAVLGDIWDTVERGTTMAFCAMMVFVGPSLGPIISGFLQMNENWRWAFYVLLWLSGGTAILLLTLPETYGPAILTERAKMIRQAQIPGYETVQSPAEATGLGVVETYKITLLRPWQLLVDPISFLCALYLTVVYTLLYMLFSVYPIVFQEMRGWNAGVGNLPLLGTTVGAMISFGINAMVARGAARKILSGIVLTPEDRLPVAMVGGIGFPIAMFWLGWTAAFTSIHWAVPTVAGGLLACSLTLVFNAFQNYLVDTYLRYAASAIAANTVCRSAAGAASPLFTTYMYNALGVGGGCSLIGGVATLLAIIPFLFYKYGAQLRAKSAFGQASEAKA